MHRVETKERLKHGDVLRIDCSHQATVRVMDGFNYALYERGFPFDAFGGFTCFFPQSYTIPYPAVWHAVLEFERKPPGLEAHFGVCRAEGRQSACPQPGSGLIQTGARPAPGPFARAVRQARGEAMTKRGDHRTWEDVNDRRGPGVAVTVRGGLRRIQQMFTPAADVPWDQAVLFLLAVFVGVLVAYLALGFRFWVDGLHWYGFTARHERLVEAAARLPAWRLFAVPILGSLVVAAILRFIIPGFRPHGVAETMEAASLREGRIDTRTGIGSVLAAATALGAGASTGREGPMVHAGATLASWIAKRLHLSTGLTRTLLGCGAASAVAASFNAPIAGVIFALEVVVGHYTLHVWAPVVVAGVAGTVVTRAHLGDNPAFTVPPLEILSFWEFPAFLFLGILSAVIGITFMRSVMAAERLRRKVTKWPDWALPPVAGVAMGCVALVVPELLGVSYETTDKTLDGEMGLRLLLMLIPLKILASSLCLACRFGGGVFSPSLFLGAITGGAFGLLAAQIAGELAWPVDVSSSGVYTIVGMAAVASAVLGAPISTMLIVFELTGNYEVTIAVMIASAVASLITQLFYRHSLFILQLEQRNIRLEGGKATHLLEATPVRSAMRTDFAVVQEADSYAYVRSLIMAHEGTMLPVVDETGRLEGVVTLGRMIDADRRLDRTEPMLARHLCTRDPVRITADAPLGDGLISMEQTGDESLPVIKSADDPVVVGMLFHTDVLEAYNRALLETQGR